MVDLTRLFLDRERRKVLVTFCFVPYLGVYNTIFFAI